MARSEKAHRQLERGAARDVREDYPLIRAAQAGGAGGVAARNALIVRHFGFIFQTTKRYAPPRDDAQEWVSHGVEGFINAVRKFDLAKDVSLLTYAHQAVARRMFRAVQQGRLIRPASTMRTDALRAQSKRTGRVLSLDHTTAHWRLGLAAPAVSGGADGRARLGDALERLPPRSMEVVRLRIGGCTLEMIGARLGIVKERVRQIYEEALVVLRRRMESGGEGTKAGKVRRRGVEPLGEEKKEHGSTGCARPEGLAPPVATARRPSGAKAKATRAGRGRPARGTAGACGTAGGAKA